FRELFPTNENDYSSVNFTGEWMPRVAANYLITENINVRGSIGKGYSTPTTGEVRPSDNIINRTLKAETGWNYETGIRWFNPWFEADASVFYYRMQDALVRRGRENGAEYFTNAGTVNQRGIEMQLNSKQFTFSKTSIVKGLQLGSGLTISDFNFGEYKAGNNDFSGNKLTGVPSTIIVTHLNTQFAKNISLYLQHSFTSEMPLNDANTDFADSYHLVQAKLSFKPAIKRLNVNFFFAADNILNEKYSLGYDINAFGNRYYNAAPRANFFIGGSIRL